MSDPLARCFPWAVLLAALVGAGCGSPKPATPPYAVPERPRPEAEADTPGAAEVALPTGPFTLDAAVRHAVERSGQVAALRWSAYATRQGAYANVQYRDPQLRLRYGEDELEERGARTESGLAPTTPSDVSRNQEGDSLGIGLRFFPRNPVVTHWMKREGHTAGRAAEELVREAQWRVATETRHLFLYAQYLEQDYRLLTRHQASCRGLVQQAKARHEQGELAGPDVYRLLRRCIETDGDVARRRQDLNLNRRTLAALLEVPPGDLELLPFDADATTHLVQTDVEALCRRALQQRPDLAVLTYTTEAARLGLSSARAGRIPWIEYIQGSYGEAEADEVSGTRDALGGGDVTETELSREEWRIDAALTLPLFSWAGKRPRQAKALYEAAVEYEMDLREAIEAEVRAAAEDARFMSAGGAVSIEEGEALLDEAGRLAVLLEQDVGGSPQEVYQLREDILRIERVHLRQQYEAQAARARLLDVLGVVYGDE